MMGESCKLSIEMAGETNLANWKLHGVLGCSNKSIDLMGESCIILSWWV